jgi:hypothetical protein
VKIDVDLEFKHWFGSKPPIQGTIHGKARIRMGDRDVSGIPLVWVEGDMLTQNNYCWTIGDTNVEVLDEYFDSFSFTEQRDINTMLSDSAFKDGGELKTRVERFYKEIDETRLSVQL